MENSKKIQVNCVGLGQQFEKHLLPELVKQESKVESLNIYDLESKRIDLIKEKLISNGLHNKLKKNTPESFHDLIKDAHEQPSLGKEIIFIISTPADTHFDLAKECLEKGFHTYIDKPFTLNTKEGKILVDIAREKNIGIVIGAQRRFESIYESVLNCGKSIGDLTKVHFHNRG